MFDDDDKLQSPGLEEGAHALLQELEQNTPAQIRRQRAHFRLAVKAAVVLYPGSASDVTGVKVRGATGDISAGGCSVLFPVPVRVGDVYRLEFDRTAIDLPLTFARCVRCRLVREDAYEAGLSFFSPVTLPESAKAEASDVIS